METYWVPGVNNHGHYGRWAFAEFTEVYRIEADFNEFTEVYRIEADFKARVEKEFNKMINQVLITGKV